MNKIRYCLEFRVSALAASECDPTGILKVQCMYNVEVRGVQHSTVTSSATTQKEGTVRVCER